MSYRPNYILPTTYFFVELNDTEKDPDVDEHANKDMSLHLLYTYDVIHQLEKRCQFKPHKDLFDATPVCIVHF